MIDVRFVIFTLFLVKIAAAFEGDNCTVQETDQDGTCISVHECEHAKKLLQSHKKPQHCGFNKQTPLVCCPSHHEQTPGVKSTEECNEYHAFESTAVIIAFGEKAASKEFPHMAAVGFGNKDSIVWLCGGSLISHEFVLTAAHCVRSREFGPAKWIRLGDLDLKNKTENADPQDIAISQTIAHPDYKAPSHYNDIALMKLEKWVEFGNYIKPACLYPKMELPKDKFQATGWGKTDYFGDVSSHLMKVELNVIKHETCAKRFLNLGIKLRNGITDETQICAGDPMGKDTCPGDSGGPLQFLNEGSGSILQHFMVVGVTSFGRGCGFENSAGVYTRVSSYLAWIENIVWP